MNITIVQYLVKIDFKIVPVQYLFNICSILFNIKSRIYFVIIKVYLFN